MGAGAAMDGALGGDDGTASAGRSRAMTGGGAGGRGAAFDGGAGKATGGFARGAGDGVGRAGLGAGTRYTASSPRSDTSSGVERRTCGSRHIAATCTSIDSAMASQMWRGTPSRLSRYI